MTPRASLRSLEAALGWLFSQNITASVKKQEYDDTSGVIGEIYDGMKTIISNASTVAGRELRHSRALRQESDALLDRVGARVYGNGDRPAWIRTMLSEEYPKELRWDNDDDRRELYARFWQLVLYKIQYERTLKRYVQPTTHSTSQVESSEHSPSSPCPRKGSEPTVEVHDPRQRELDRLLAHALRPVQRSSPSNGEALKDMLSRINLRVLYTSVATDFTTTKNLSNCITRSDLFDKLDRAMQLFIEHGAQQADVDGILLFPQGGEEVPAELSNLRIVRHGFRDGFPSFAQHMRALDNGMDLYTIDAIIISAE